jgi:hypothetical protein
MSWAMIMAFLVVPDSSELGDKEGVTGWQP